MFLFISDVFGVNAKLYICNDSYLFQVFYSFSY